MIEPDDVALLRAESLPQTLEHIEAFPPGEKIKPRAFHVCERLEDGDFASRPALREALHRGEPDQPSVIPGANQQRLARLEGVDPGADPWLVNKGCADRSVGGEFSPPRAIAEPAESQVRGGRRRYVRHLR